jgi:hypothetical protein
VTFRAAIKLHKLKVVPWCDVLLQVHDSLILQWPKTHSAQIGEIRKAITIPIPYPDPLTIQWGLKTSTESWGKVEDRKWPA